MATTSSIAYKDPETGEFYQIYCHWDGMIGHNGSILKTHYNSLDRVKELLSFGDLSSLGEHIYPSGNHSFDKPEKNVCVFYGRDRGEDNTQAKKHNSNVHFSLNGRQEQFNYLFIDGNWKVSCGGLKHFLKFLPELDQNDQSDQNELPELMDKLVVGDEVTLDNCAGRILEILDNVAMVIPYNTGRPVLFKLDTLRKL